MENGFDALVVGSGFGGSVAALRLAEKGYRVGVLEAGRRFEAGDFARTSWNLRRFLFAPRLGCHGIQRITFLRDLVVLSGAGVGGGSLVYANVLYEPHAADPALRPHYDTVRAMLGATATPFESAADLVVRRIAERAGAAATYRPTTVAVDFDACVRCGGCMVGCRYGAKNTLDRNYLRQAEQLGARVLPGHEARALHRDADGWLVAVHRRDTFRAREVVVAAGVLGSVKLLATVPGISTRLGENVRTNAETLVGATAADTRTDYSQGIAIGSSFEPRPGIQIQPVRYPRGSNSMALLAKPLSPKRWAERTILLLCMGTAEERLRLTVRRGRVRSASAHPPATRIPEADEAAAIAAELIGGHTGRLRWNRAVTAHILGGATEIVDSHHRVVGQPGLHVVDGSTVAQNLGVNPALTIAAQAERALDAWPRKGEPDLRPPLA